MKQEFRCTNPLVITIYGLWNLYCICLVSVTFWTRKIFFNTTVKTVIIYNKWNEPSALSQIAFNYSKIKTRFRATALKVILVRIYLASIDKLQNCFQFFSFGLPDHHHRMVAWIVHKDLPKVGRRNAKQKLVRLEHSKLLEPVGLSSTAGLTGQSNIS